MEQTSFGSLFISTIKSYSNPLYLAVTIIPLSPEWDERDAAIPCYIFNSFHFRWYSAVNLRIGQMPFFCRNRPGGDKAFPCKLSYFREDWKINAGCWGSWLFLWGQISSFLFFWECVPNYCVGAGIVLVLRLADQRDLDGKTPLIKLHRKL